jgi:hypothetical protein
MPFLPLTDTPDDSAVAVQETGALPTVGGEMDALVIIPTKTTAITEDVADDPPPQGPVEGVTFGHPETLPVSRRPSTTAEKVTDHQDENSPPGKARASHKDERAQGKEPAATQSTVFFTIKQVSEHNT